MTDVALYNDLLPLRAELRAKLDPGDLDTGRADRVRAIADALLAGKDAPRVYVRRAEQELELESVNNAIGQLIWRVAEAVAKKHGRGVDELNVQLDPSKADGIPESGESLIAYIENAAEMADRRDAAHDKHADQLARQDAATAEFGRLQFQHELEGDVPLIASQKAKNEMELPVEDLFALEGQVRMPQYG